MSAQNQNHPDGNLEGLGFANALRDCLVCGVLLVNHREQITFCAPAVQRLLRLAAAPTAETSLSQLPVALQKIIRHAIATGAPTIDRALVVALSGGKPVTLHVTAEPVRAEAGDWDVVVVLNELSVARQVEQSLSRLNRLAAIGTVSASMGHEIRNAMVAVKTFTGLLLDKNRDAELANVVSHELVRIDSLTSQMLQYSGPARPTLSDLRLHDILDHSLRLVQPSMEAKSISLHRSFQASPDAIKGDEYQLEQAFVNLFLNAIEAMGTKGALAVATEFVPAAGAMVAPAVEVVPAQVRVTIADTGVGVPSENLNQLFEPFFTTKNHGTGLGLPITKRILQEHHAEITVRSEVNRGTTFDILLPAGVMAAELRNQG